MLAAVSTGGLRGYLYDLAKGPQVTLRRVVETLKQTYCNTLGVVRERSHTQKEKGRQTLPAAYTV